MQILTWNLDHDVVAKGQDGLSWKMSGMRVERWVTLFGDIMGMKRIVDRYDGMVFQGRRIRVSDYPDGERPRRRSPDRYRRSRSRSRSRGSRGRYERRDSRGRESSTSRYNGGNQGLGNFPMMMPNMMMNMPGMLPGMPPTAMMPGANLGDPNAAMAMSMFPSNIPRGPAGTDMPTRFVFVNNVCLL